MMRQQFYDFFTICDSAPVPFAGSKGTKKAFCSLVLSGAVLRVPDAENLKIRPELFVDSSYRAEYVNDKG